MPSDKRARQRAMRAEKQAVIHKQRKRRATMRRGGTLGIIAVGIILIVVLIQTSGHHSAATTTTTTTAKATTTTTTGVPPSTFATPTTQPLSKVAVAPVCAPAKNTKRHVWFKKAPPNCIGQTSVWDATFDTSLGKFVIRMDAAKSYAAVNNFVFLAQWNYYNGTFFHRVIPGFVVQGGDPTGTGSGGPHAFPGYSFIGNFPPDSCKTKVTAACYQPGDFVMANSNPNGQTTQNASTDGSQFFVVLNGGQKQLNTEPTYTLFGKVTSGLKVVEAIGADGTASGPNEGTPKVKVYLLKVTLTQVTA